MSSLVDFINFIPFVYSKTYTPLLGAVTTLLVAVILIASAFILKDFKIELAIGAFIISMISYREFQKYFDGRVPQQEVSLPNQFAKPSDIINSLREDDMNTLMFGRSKFPSDVMGGEQDDRILRGYEVSSDLGDKYGTFTGVTLYDGPQLYDQQALQDVFGYDELNPVTSEKLERLRTEYTSVRQKLLKELDEDEFLEPNQELKELSEDLLEQIKTERQALMQS